MFIYRKAIPFGKKDLIRKRRLNDKQKKALDKVNEILREFESSIEDALIFMWVLEVETVNYADVAASMENVKNAGRITERFDNIEERFVNDTLRPAMTQIGAEGFVEAREQLEDIEVLELPSVLPDFPYYDLSEENEQTITPPVGGKPPGGGTPPLTPDFPEFDELPNGDEPPSEGNPSDDNTLPEDNSFDYAAFYEQWCDKHTGELIVDIDDTALANVKEIIHSAIKNGDSCQTAAQRIKDTVGLTEKQLKANENYYNYMLEQLKANHPRLSKDEIEKRAKEAAAKDADKRRRERAKNIARTEINSAHHHANAAYIKWAVEHGYMDPPDKEWVTSNKGNVCPKCLSLSGRIVPYDADFKANGTVIDIPPLHPQCCCAVIYIKRRADGSQYKRDSEWDRMSEAEKKAHKYYFSDKAQYKAYKKRLGKENVPKTLEEFQKIKYNNKERWKNLSTAYADKNLQKRIRETYDLTINEGRQGKHILGHNNYIEGRSYLTVSLEDAQELVNKYAGTGEIQRDRSNNWTHKELIQTDKGIGIALKGTNKISTSKFMIHYSKKGTHIVPSDRPLGGEK